MQWAHLKSLAAAIANAMDLSEGIATPVKKWMSLFKIIDSCYSQYNGLI